MWEVIEFGDSYKVPTTDPNGTTTTGGDAGTKSGRTVTITTEGMQRKKNNVKARTTLLLSLPDEHQLRFSKVATISQDTVSAYIASQSSGSQIKFEDINQIDEDDMEEMDIKWSVALLSMRADKFWKKIGKKISIQGLDVAGFEKSKVECFNCHKMGHFARECRAPRSQERGRKDNYRQGYKAEEKTPKALVAIDRVEWDWSYMVNEGEDHALVPDEEAPTEFVLMANTESKDGVDGKLVGLLKASKNLDNLIESQRSDKNKDRVGYSVVPPPITDLYLSPKKDLSWIGLPEFADDTVTDYSRPSPNVESTLEEGQNKNSSTTEDVATKPFVKFVKPKDGQSESKPNKKETPKKPPVKYAEQYRKSNKKPNVRGNQRNWNNLKSYQLGPEFVLKKKACFNCGDFTHLANDCKKRAHSYETRPFLKKTAVKTQYRASWVPTVNMNKPPVNRKFSTSRKNFPTANRKFPTASRKFPTDSTKIHIAAMGRKGKAGSSQNNIDDKGYWDSGCSRHMTSNISYLSDFEPFDGGYVSFGQGGCKITGKGTIKTSKLEFENVYFVKDLKYNLFSVSQICDNKNSIMFTNSKCIVLGRDFKLLDDVNILLRTPRQHNMYSIDLKNIVPHRDLTCLVAKASANECTLWHRRLDLFGPTSVNSISHKWYCLVVTDDFSRFTWTFFLRTKDETSGILKKFITKIENLKDLKVKIIREFSNARTLQQNGVAEKRNRTLIEAARTMLADAKLPVTFWAEAVNTDCYVQNRVLVNKSQNKTPYELFNDRTPAIGFLKPFGCTKDATNQEVKKDVSSLRYTALPNWVHNALLESSSSKPQDGCSPEVFEGSGNINPTASTTNPPADQIETLTDSEFPAKVYKVEKAMYGLHQAPRAWYGTLSKYLLMNGFQRGTTDQTLFIRRQRGDFILVQVYVDDIIFGSSNPQLCREFKALIHEKFQMSAMGDLNFFFGLQVLQKKDGIFLSQDKYVGDILKKFGHQVTPKECHLHAVKRIFRYLKGHPKLRLWYPKESPFYLVAYSDSDYGGATQDRKSTTGGSQFLGRRLISWQCKKQTIVATSTTEAEYVTTASCCGQVLWIQN
nr:putative ribonuclease H-like domain-containing protein [Tanacetum cinerariifolium]